ncbi:hypothetical protein LO762_31390 [Actinocorallia sp. API 0066]|uniref:hypothetical protein n=1 Tax=Actinocorallia sp. API 0066 TaxID=2896846 RepID=UPI001E2F4C6F|nr:hypothetical protein [Actinocorallia sp. API 0066]MCD0453656.1 hypothetical protein [Actinocorallia sp. API 0066]
MKPLAVALAAVLTLSLTACGGGGAEKEGAAPETSASTSAAPAEEPGAPGLSPKTGEPLGEPLVEPSETGKPAPKPQPSQVKPLVGTWQGDGPVKEYFVFTAKGEGELIAGGKTLWSGTVIPAGKNTYRLSWEGTDPGATYWQVVLKDGGKSFTFAANSQTYKKVTKPATGKPETPKPEES